MMPQNFPVSPPHDLEFLRRAIASLTTELEQYKQIQQHTLAKIQEFETKHQKHTETVEREIGDIFICIIKEIELLASTRGNRDVVLHNLHSGAHGIYLKDDLQRFFDHLNKQHDTHAHTDHPPCYLQAHDTGTHVTKINGNRIRVTFGDNYMARTLEKWMGGGKHTLYDGKQVKYSHYRPATSLLRYILDQANAAARSGQESEEERSKWIHRQKWLDQAYDSDTPPGDRIHAIWTIMSKLAPQVADAGLATNAEKIPWANNHNKQPYADRQRRYEAGPYTNTYTACTHTHADTTHAGRTPPAE